MIRELHKKRLPTPADNLALLTQPGRQHPRLGVLIDLLHSAEQSDTDAFAITPPVTI